MILVQTRVAQARTRTRRNVRRAERIEIVRPLLERSEQGLPVRNRHLKAVATAHRVSARTIRRWIEEAGQEEPAIRHFVPDRELLVRVAMHSGNVLAAYREMLAENRQGVASWELPSYKTVHRRIHADPGLQVALREGTEAAARFLQVGESEPEHRNEVWYMDGMHVPVKCQDRFGRVIDDLWLMSAFDAYSRLVVSHAVHIGQATAEITAAVLLAGAMGRIVSAEELSDLGIDSAGPAFVGGAPDQLVLDNALANKSEEMRDAVTLCGSALHYGRPHIAVDKAKQERWHGTLQGFITALPGYLDGPRTHPADGHQSRPYTVPADGDLPRVETVVETLNEVIADYNTCHIVSTTGQEPLRRFLADTAFLRPIEPATLWSRMTPLGTYRVQPRGVKVDGTYRIVTHPKFITGTDVEVRGLLVVPDRLFFGVDDGFCDEVKLHRNLSEAEIIERTISNAVRGRTARSILREAGERLVEEGIPEDQRGHRSEPTEDRPVLARPAPTRRRKAAAPAAPGLKAALEMEWTDQNREGAA